MKSYFRILVMLVIFASAQISYAQTDKEKAYKKWEEAYELEEAGKFTDAIKILEEAQKLDPDNIGYPYEIAFAYSKIKEYKKAISIAEKLLNHKDAVDLFYELIGNAYDYLGNPDKAIETYETGLKKFPNSGRLNLEIGIVRMNNGNEFDALKYYENGIKVDPKFPSNYYWAGKIYFNTAVPVWGMIYGEIFMNLERGTTRTEEMSKLLYDTYKSQIKFATDSNIFVCFSTTNAIYISPEMIDKRPLLRFNNVFEILMKIPAALEENNGIDINSLDRIRKGFLELYYQKGFDTSYPNILFEYQKKILESENLEAYNHWVLMQGDIDAFDKWLSDNKEKWDKFMNWFEKNPLKIDENHRFYRRQY